MKEATLYIFSASSLSKLKHGDYGPTLSKKYPFRPTVKEKLEVIAKDISLWQGEKYVHNVSDKGKNSKGSIIGFKGPGADMALWTELLDRFEKEFGMKKDKRWFYTNEENGFEVQAIIYYLPKPRTKKNKDGKLVRINQPSS